MRDRAPFLFEEFADLESEEVPQTRQRSVKKEGREECLTLFLFPEMKEEAVPEALLQSRLAELTPSLRCEDVVVALTDPVIIFGLWGDAVPQWLKDQIRIDRLLVLEAKTGEIGTDSEALAYISTVSLSVPLSHDWATIYQYLLTKIFSALGKDVPDDLKVEKIAGFQESLLSDLKHWIFRVRRRTRTKNKGERRKDEKK